MNYPVQRCLRKAFNTSETHLSVFCCGSVQVRDAVAVIQLLMWLEKAVPEGKETELTAAAYVNSCRRWVHTMYEKGHKAYYLVLLTLQVQNTKNKITLTSSLQQTEGQQRPKLWNYLCKWTQRCTRTLQVTLTHSLTHFWFSSSRMSYTWNVCLLCVNFAVS